MSFRRGVGFLRVMAGTALVAGMTAFSAVGPIRAQPGDATPYPVMSAERAWAFVQAAERKLDYLPGEVLVKFKPGTSPDAQQRALMALRSRPAISDLQWIAEDTALHRDKSEWNANILAAQLREQPEVIYAEPNYLRRLDFMPSDPGFSRQWNFTAIDMPRAWDINPGGSNSLIVAVVDSGVTTVTEGLRAFTWNGVSIQAITVPVAISPDLNSSRFVTPADFINSNGATPIVVDAVGHGTHVASTIAENTNDGLGEAGMAFNVKIMPVKVCASYWDVQFGRSAAGLPGFTRLNDPNIGCPDAAEYAGIRYAADHGAKVINVSIGGAHQNPLLLDALTYAVGKGAFQLFS